jgi:hypothetical protein
MVAIIPYLNFKSSPRLNPFTSQEIQVCHTTTTIRERTKWAILVSALEAGYEKLEGQQKKQLINNVATYYSYMGGYSNVVGDFGTFRRWHDAYKKANLNGELETIFKNNKKCGRLPYSASLDLRFPGFLHECYRYATSILGSDARLSRTMTLMEEYAKSKYRFCPIRGDLTLTYHHFYSFFNSFKGKYIKPITKPRLNKTQIEDRLRWALKWKEWARLPKSRKHCCFLDEKWFYISSKRRKIRILPPHPLTESPTDAHVQYPKVRSRRFPLKVMFQGIVSKPYPEHNFDGHIMIKRVSEKHVTKKTSYNTGYDDSYHINSLLRDGEWMFTCTIDDNTSIQEVLSEIHCIYGLEDSIIEKLCFSYYSHNSNGKKEVKRILSDDSNSLLIGNRYLTDENGSRRLLTISDLQLHVRIPSNTEIQRDTTCDSKFMLETVHDVGTSIRASMHWIHPDEPITLFMDNAGGHGTNLAKEEYVRILSKKYKILVEWQIPNSPDTNILDLGFWATHQAIVERMHRLKRMDADSLARTVIDAFRLVDRDKISRIYDRWEYVLELIVQGEGTNDLVESNRGLRKSLEGLPDVSRFYNY